MSLVDSGNGIVMPVAPTGGGFGGYGAMNGDWSFWLLILFLFAFMGNGWGAGNGTGTTVIGNDVQRGFDQATLTNGINGINSAICSGFANVEANAAARQMADMQQYNALAMALQNCCCENRAAIADVKYAIANDGAATRNTVTAGNQQILDKLCQLELDGIKQNYENRISGMQNTIETLRSQINEQSRQASQNLQTAQIIADNAAQTAALEQYLAPTPRPAWIVQNPNCCTGNTGCGCSV